MHLLKWLQPGYKPEEGGGKKRGKNKTKPPRHLPRMYKAFNVHGDTLPRHQEDRPEESEGGEGPSEGQHARGQQSWGDAPKRGQKRGRAEKQEVHGHHGEQWERTRGPWSETIAQQHKGWGKSEERQSHNPAAVAIE